MARGSELFAIADLIERFIDGTIGRWEWDDFTSIRGKEPELEKLRQEIVLIADRFPRTTAREWCSEAGVVELRNIAARLRSR